MKLSILHRTTFLYGEPARDNVNEVRICPLHTFSQNREFFVLKVIPATRLRTYYDLFSNLVYQFGISHAHSRLVIEARSLITTESRVDYEALPYGVSHAALAACDSDEGCHQFLVDSKFVQRTPEIWREAMDIRGDSTDVFQTCYALMAFIFERCVYQAGITDSETDAQHVFIYKSGVCQDFTHLMLAYCRALGIPARYVSGYVWDPGHDRGSEVMRGSQASHAWAEVFIPDHGWIGMDPTNNKVVNDQYVVISIGRDYEDVAPVHGSFYGGGQHRSMSVQVDVRKAGRDVMTA
ncbi:MAG: transglutaminase family protein [Akkermansiaceae bacterium]|nr:transglutaminase family protein [Akkermansiaceae bacterium]NNM29049.1 transglutaminase family protein [Akkermansiaceae bacterium]